MVYTMAIFGGLILGLIQLDLVLVTSAIEIPILNGFTKYAHGLDSGRVTLVDAKTMQITNFKYDGKGPDAFFQVKQRSNQNSPSTFPKERDDLSANARIPDETGSCDKVKGYTGKDITLTLPSNLTFANVDYLALYCYEFQHNFGFVTIPQNLAGLNQYPSDKTTPKYCSGSSSSMEQLMRNGRVILLPALSIMAFAYLLNFM